MWYRVPLLLVGWLLVSTVVQGDSRIAFSSDRSNGNRNIWKIKDDGSSPTEVTTESFAALNPTIAPGGHWVLYEASGGIWMSDFANPVGDPVYLGNGSDPAAGRAINGAGDFRFVYTKNVDGTDEIHMATVDISVPEIVSDVSLTPNPYLDEKHGAFCGSSHFVWSHNTSYDTAICYQGFDANGPVDPPTCWLGGFEDGFADEHPSCSSDGRLLAWSREETNPQYNGTFDVWVRFIEDAYPPFNLTPGTHTSNETMPVWAPGDGQVAYASNQPPEDEPANVDYEIWKRNWDGTGTPVQLTDNDDQDDAPSWGPAVLH